MNAHPAKLLLISIFPLWIDSCGDKKPSETEKPDPPAETVDPVRKAAAKKLKIVKDPTIDEIETASHNCRQAYNNSRFDELEKLFTQARDSKTLFRDGEWKLERLYRSLTCRDEEPENMWELHDKIHESWIAAKPESLTARIAHADFFVAYAWHARGNGYANKVPPKAWKTFEIRLAKAAKILEKAKELNQKDPYYWHVLMTVGKGQGWDKATFDSVVEKSVAEEPKYYPIDEMRATTLLPRWYGEPGDWEAYALKAAERPDGLGAETYARIVLALWGYHDNIFRETKISWPKTKEGLQLLRTRYPDCVKHLHLAARFAAEAGDIAYSKECFDQIGDNVLLGIWSNSGTFLKYREWVQKEAAKAKP